ncbi:MAG: helix-turn-helix domain-containing protein, partial [Pirellulales bacterium]|nr:helix-turn-helix domain-containing protein [Pirellulales bacterium]
ISQSKKEKIREALATLATAHAQAVAEIQKAINGLSLVLELEEQFDNSFGRRGKRSHRPRADRDTLSIIWKGKSCFFGYTLLFLFFERLARSPNSYVSHIDLLEDVWGGDRGASTIRGVAKRLRDRLHEEGMGQVADAIDGSVTGYYGLKPV